MPHRRRGQHEGSCYQRASDGKWVAAIDLGWSGGKRQRRYYYGATQAEALDKLHDARHQQRRGTRLDADRLTVAAFLSDWLELDVKPTKEPLTYESYERTVRLHLAPELGRHRLTTLLPQHVQALLRHKQASGLSARSVQNIRAVLRIALGRAMKWELVDRNVATLVDVPKVEREEVHPWTHDEAMRFLDSCRTHRLGALFAVALAMGLRKGEALGLRWQDVDFVLGRLSVRHQLQRTKERGLILKVPKTPRSRRTLPLPDEVAVSLLAHATIQWEEREVAGRRWRQTNHVFATTIGTPIEPTSVNEVFNRLVARAGVPVQRFHDQRHWCATLLLAQGVAPRVVMELLGHTQISTTLSLYGHVLDEDRIAAAALMDRVLQRSDGGLTALEREVNRRQ
jgi:integrase